ncbi:hypothetical protein [Paenibacillus harenae]|uniref:Uncharacterized protein n=1 Tax=Paenibacillus harenae TaxID=306543 RepID=A0ABT9U1W9_PAEHA|nr:hypothetical protein [Paenibacillus harenae]MDQ0112314.1 hypothetical protein [Paenibacillus harenae]
MAYELYSAVDLYAGQPGVALTDLVTLKQKTILKSVVIHNTTGLSAKLKLYIIRPGKSANAETQRIGTSIAGEDTIKFSFETVLPKGTKLAAVQVTAGALSLDISGVEVIPGV